MMLDKVCHRPTARINRSVQIVMLGHDLLRPPEALTVGDGQ
jgi:hypothetical protein